MFADRVKRSNSDLLYIVRGKDRGRSAWYYVLIESKAKLPLFQKALNEKQIHLEEYGEVIYSGFGEDPPENIQNKVEEEYG